MTNRKVFIVKNYSSDMKIKGLRLNVELRYNLATSDLDKAKRDLYAGYRNARKENLETQSVLAPKRKVRISHADMNVAISERTTFPKYIYQAMIQYQPAVELSWDLIEFDQRYMGHYFDLPFSKRNMLVFPSKFRFLKDAWACSLSSESVRSDQDRIKPKYTLDVFFPGLLRNETQEQELESMVDGYFLPEEGKDGYWHTQKFGGGSRGGGGPEIVLRKTFNELINPSAEKTIKAFYDSLVQFILDNEITTGVRTEEGGLTLEREVKKHTGLDVSELIAASTPSVHMPLSPFMIISATIPEELVRQELIRGRDGEVRKYTKESVYLSYYPESLSIEDIKSRIN